MTVGELREKLNDYPDDWDVKLGPDDEHITDVETDFMAGDDDRDYFVRLATNSYSWSTGT